MRKTTPNLPANKTDIASVEVSASAKFQAGNYKDAIELYKTLLKNTEKSEWRQTLAQCYLQRALVFSTRGMVKEAIVLWESYAQHSAIKSEYLDHFIAWLLQTNDSTKIKKYLPQLSTQQLDEHYPMLANTLGLLMISGRSELEGLLPQDSLLIKHLQVVRAVLAAYRDNKHESVETHLQQLPFRSAFRDFRAIMKAVLMFSTDKDNAQTQLAKILADSPYHKLANSLLACTHDGMALVNDLPQLSHKQGQLVAIAKKFTKKQLELFDVVLKQKDRLSDKAKFNLALQYQELFGVDFARRYCYSALAYYSQGHRDFTKQFGALDEFEECRFKALSYQRNNNLFDALYYWKRGAAILKAQQPVDGLKLASLMRHIADKEYSPAEGIGWLEESLDHDPDRDSHLKVLGYYANKPQQVADYKQWLDKSLEQFPQDVDFLLVAINEAAQRQAFKEVVAYAQSVLNIDPVNSVAKQALFDSHLAQLRLLIKDKKKWPKLTAAMQDIQNLALSKRDQLIVGLMQGFCTFVSDKDLGVNLIAEAVQAIYDGVLTAHFYVMMEASAMGLQLTPVLKKLPPLAKDYAMPAKELTQFTALILQCHNKADSQAFVGKVLDKIKAPIKRSLASKHYDEDVLLAFCQCLAQISHFELMRACVKSPHTLWAKPIGMYYRVYAESNGDATKCSESNADRLDDSLGVAYDEQDHRTIVLIEKFLDGYYQNDFNPKNLDIMGSLLGMGSSKADPIALFNHLPSDMFEKLDKKAEELIKKMGMERFLTAVIRQYFSGDGLSAMTLLMTNFEALQAFALLKAAEELNIDTQVTGVDIVKCIKGNAPSLPSFLK
jgi:tetratricopeptide (TPR) repeat protein